MTTEVVGIEPLGNLATTWPVRFGGEEHERLNEKYAEAPYKLDEQERNRVFNTAAQILGQCPDPNGPLARRTGLAIGKVQSGKTISYIALTALAFDSGYRVVIVLAGRTTPLADQNRKRYDADLDMGNRATPKIAGGFHNPDIHNATEIQAVLENDGLVLITLLKTPQRIDNIREIFASAELSNYPILVIDDEGDQASHNAKRYQNEQSAVYARILRMRNAMPHHAYVAYTATPQANLLAATIDVLAPEFCVLVEPGSGYTGGSTFFGADKDHYIRIVPDDEADNDHFVGVPDHLRLTIATFLIAGAIRHLREPHAFHSMLIHHSNRKDDHRRLQEAVQALLDGWKEALRLPDTDPGTGEALELGHRAYDDLCATASNCPRWPEISTQLRQEVKALKVWLVNSLPQASNPITTPFNLQNNIMIGGNMLDRGVTIQGLAVTYITRRARDSQADTIEQRARWFGYKRSYLDICRIFTTQLIADTYTELLSHEDDFWASLRRNEVQGLPVTQWPRLFRLGLGLRPTRASVARTRAFRGGGWLIQTEPTLDPHVAASNVAAVRAFFATQPTAGPRAYGTATHILAPACDPEAVIELLAIMDHSEDQDWDSSYIIEYLERLVLGRQLTAIDVLVMSAGQARVRTAVGGRINPMEGPRRLYPGDYNIHNDRVQLQAHIVQVHTNGGAPLPDETIALGLYVPVGPQYDLGRLVVPSE